ncbi:DUF6999 family protein [Vibrio rumoiensis]|uniref:Uncharacterized protein n=1 Tax=Vibrio rumoiensis 1S-45 TaxID=1188252 RepID=A0A1E5E100_9VIBR|nr:hypothetical protein [Vibrio rumoiensis]OEF24237.1 hypothetical protein A1QC_10470 [Vibrio rumoiensis 1S-45]
MSKPYSAMMRAIAVDNSLPIEKVAVELWLKDLNNPLRWIVRPVLQVIFVMLLHLVWLFKRLPLPAFSAHQLLQKLICWFCIHFVKKEANLLILRHYATESNILNFLIANSDTQHNENLKPVNLYPKTIQDMLGASFVDHDQHLFDTFADLGEWQKLYNPKSHIQWEHWQPINMDEFEVEERRTQFLDFESAHALFMCLFCLLLTKEEYRDAINGFNLDQSIAIRIGQIIGDPSLSNMAYNQYPLYFVGPWNLGQRFLMHGFFTEHLYAELETRRTKSLT